MTNKELENYTPNIEIYNSSTGYSIKNVNANQHAMYQDSKGIIWIVTNSAKTDLVRFDYKAIHKNTNLPELIIQNLDSSNKCNKTIVFDRRFKYLLRG